MPDEPPNVTYHPEDMVKVCPGTTVTFSVQATGTEPLSYQWQWCTDEELHGSREWQLCHMKCDSATLSIPSVQKSNNGNYRCVVSNYAGTQTSNPAQLSVGKNLTLMCLCLAVLFLTHGLFNYIPS